MLRCAAFDEIVLAMFSDVHMYLVRVWGLRFRVSGFGFRV